MERHPVYRAFDAFSHLVPLTCTTKLEATLASPGDRDESSASADDSATGRAGKKWNRSLPLRANAAIVGQIICSESEGEPGDEPIGKPTPVISICPLGDPAKFSIVYDRYSATVARFVAVRVEESVVEDLLVETFLQAFRSRSRFKPAQL
jgi:hypothetical protein